MHNQTATEREQRLPLFIVPGYLGATSFPTALVQRLSQRVECLDGLRHPGWDGREKPLARVEDIAAALIPQIREFRPHGPYGLCGLSFGGLVAFEVARQLRAQGAEVEALILWDAVLHTIGLAENAKVRKRPLPEVLSRIWHRFSQRDLAGKGAFVRRMIGARWKNKRIKIHGKGAPVQSGAWTEGQGIVPTCRQAHLKYVPEPCDGDAVLFKSIDHGGNFEEITFAPDLGWSRFVRGRLEVVGLHGDHSDIFEEPNIRVLADKTAEWLETRPVLPAKPAHLG